MTVHPYWYSKNDWRRKECWTSCTICTDDYVGIIRRIKLIPKNIIYKSHQWMPVMVLVWAYICIPNWVSFMRVITKNFHVTVCVGFLQVISFPFPKNWESGRPRSHFRPIKSLLRRSVLSCHVYPTHIYNSWPSPKSKTWIDLRSCLRMSASDVQRESWE